MARETVDHKPDHNQAVAHRPASYDVFILAMTVYSLIVTVGILWPGHPTSEAILYWSDFLVCVVFLVDFLINLRQAPNKVTYFLKQGGWLDLLGAIPAVPGFPWTALFRFARLNRLVRIIQHLRGKEREELRKESRQSRAGTVLLSTILVAFLLLTVASLSILRFERSAPEANITSGATAFWWAFVTMTTVGYGDYVPVTHAGRILAIGLMTFGIGVFAVMTSFLASRFAVPESEEEDWFSQVREENAIIRAELAELKALIKQQSEPDERE